jgi:hypothetical protein
LPPFHPVFDHSNYIWWAYANNKLLITEVFHSSSYVLGLKISFSISQTLNDTNEIWPLSLLLGYPNWLFTCYRLDVLGFKPRCRQELFTSPQPSTAALGPIWPPVQWVLRVFPRCKGAGSWCWPTTPV